MIKDFSKKNIFTIIFLTVFLSIIFYINWIVWILSTIFSLLIYSLFTYFFYFLYKKIFRKKYLFYIDFLKLFLYRASIWLLIIIVFIWWFSYYSNEINPAKMPTYTISNGKKIVIFQAMSHIWKKSFYEKVKQNLIKAKKNWFVYFFEWVRPWTKENKKDFDKAIWIKFDKNLYKNFSKLYGVTNQDNRIFLWLVNNLDFNVDLSIDDIMKYYKKYNFKNPNLSKTQQAIDVNKEIIKTLSKLNPKELAILRYINQAILNVIISSPKARTTISDNFWNKNLFKVILEERNKNLVKNITKSKYNKIFITYWLMHFDGVFKLLKQKDKNWKIIKVNYLYPIWK